MHFMIAAKSSDVKVKRVSRLAESKSRCCISHNFGGFYQIIGNYIRKWRNATSEHSRIDPLNTSSRLAYYQGLSGTKSRRPTSLVRSGLLSGNYPTYQRLNHPRGS